MSRKLLAYVCVAALGVLVVGGLIAIWPAGPRWGAVIVGVVAAGVWGFLELTK